MLTDTNKKWELVVSECLVTQARFEPLQEKYKALAKFEVFEDSNYFSKAINNL